VVLRTTSGESITTDLTFTYTAAAVPVAEGMSPDSGSVAGGTVVVITGTDLAEVEAVQFPDDDGTDFSVNSAGTQITTTVPPTADGPGPVDVVLRTTSGESITTDLTFTYTAAAVPSATPTLPSGSEGIATSAPSLEAGTPGSAGADARSTKSTLAYTGAAQDSLWTVAGISVILLLLGPALGSYCRRHRQTEWPANRSS
jgi:hypothetical protein